MAVYKLQKKTRTSRRVAVRAERIEWNVPAIIVCVLMAFAIWLYIVSFSHKDAEKVPETNTPTATAAVTDEYAETASSWAALV